MLKIFDINKSMNIPDDSYWVDTQVLLWYFYYPIVNISAMTYQLKMYPNFIAKLLDKNSIVATTIFNISELIPCIERNQYDIYVLANNLIKKTYKFKEFRNNPQNKKALKLIIENVILQIKNVLVIESFDYCMDDITSFINGYEITDFDFFDYILFKRMIKSGSCNLITDDRDFTCIHEDTTLYTANNNLISKAKTSGAEILN